MKRKHEAHKSVRIWMNAWPTDARVHARMCCVVVLCVCVCVCVCVCMSVVLCGGACVCVCVHVCKCVCIYMYVYIYIIYLCVCARARVYMYVCTSSCAMPNQAFFLPPIRQECRASGSARGTGPPPPALVDLELLATGGTRTRTERRAAMAQLREACTRGRCLRRRQRTPPGSHRCHKILSERGDPTAACSAIQRWAAAGTASAHSHRDSHCSRTHLQGGSWRARGRWCRQRA